MIVIKQSRLQRIVLLINRSIYFDFQDQKERAEYQKCTEINSDTVYVLSLSIVEGNDYSRGKPN